MNAWDGQARANGILSKLLLDQNILMDKSQTPVITQSSELSLETGIETRRCLNCSELLSGLYCSKCGQKDISYSKPLRSVLSLFADSFFSLDSRTLRSVWLLLVKPGYLSAQFVKGKMISFTSPVKLFLFSSIFYFFLFNISLKTQGRQYNEWLSKQASSKQQEAIKMAEELRNTYSTNLATDPADTIIPPKKTAMASSETAPKNLAGRISEKTKNPERLKNTLLKGFSYMLLVLIPLFALLLKWIMGKKQQFYFDHLVVAVHFHAFALLFLSFNLLVRIMGLTIKEHLLLLAVGLYFIVAVKRFYKANWIVSIAKSAAILSLYGFLFTIALVSTALIIIAL